MKVAVRKVITMMNLYLLSSTTLESIIYMADNWDLSLEYRLGYQFSHYTVEYPNGYSVSISSDDYWDNLIGVGCWWRLAIWKEGELCRDDGMEAVHCLAEDGLIAVCNGIRNL